MRIILEFIFSDPKSPSFFSHKSNEHIQGLIYHNLPDEQGEWLHEEGFVYEKRNFKLFTFSRILGRMAKQKVQGGFLFYSPIQVHVASPVQWILESVADSLIREGSIFLGNNQIHLNSIAVQSPQKFSSSHKIRMLSPMTTYSTFVDEEEKKKTFYYSPFDPEFSESATENLRKKYFVLFRKESEGSVKITPLFSQNERKERIIRYRDFIIKAWDGEYQIEGDSELVAISYNTGLGSKNSQGFGMWEKME